MTTHHSGYIFVSKVCGWPRTCRLANFVDLDMIIVGTDGLEASEPQVVAADARKLLSCRREVWVITYLMQPKSCTRRRCKTQG